LADGTQHAPQAGQGPERGAGERETEGHERRLVEVTAGAGLVRVRVDGRGRIRHLDLDPAAFERRDAELLADLILGALAEAQRRAAELAEGGPSGAR
jgi:DNA-binding protein YbaB